VTPVERKIAEHLKRGVLRAAADESVRGYGEEIAGYLLALLREEAAADEVFSRVCEKLWHGLPKFRQQSSLRTWLYRLAWNAARDFQKEQERTPVRPLHTAEISGIAAEIAASRPPFERSSFVDAFAKLRESLDPQEQTLLTLRLHAAMSWNEIAEGVGRKPAALRKLYGRLKARLRKQADAAGLLRP
jgi:RNA polymerase sigma-70 factor (ECF subfamily)